jgi:hypothetical protein
MDVLLITTYVLIVVLAVISLAIFFILPALTAPQEKRSRARRALLEAMVLGTLYAGFCHLLARISGQHRLFEVVTLGYVFVLPLVIGFLAVWRSFPEQSSSWRYCTFAPLGAATLTLLCSILVGWEGAICVIVGGFAFIPLASVGGLCAGLLLARGRKERLNTYLLPVLLTLPLLSSAVESSIGGCTAFSSAKTKIVINAPKSVVWQNIIRVPLIAEPLDGAFYKIGFPKPLSADLSHEGVGGVRHARFERGLEFVETVNEWVREKSIGFEIKVDPEVTPLTTLDEHVTVGGRYFDVLHGRYEIEEIATDKVVLHLESTFRVSTTLNFYADLWAHLLMSDIQNTILKVIRSRCERTQTPSAS